jgi:hypothetical protein
VRKYYISVHRHPKLTISDNPQLPCGFDFFGGLGGTDEGGLGLLGVGGKLGRFGTAGFEIPLDIRAAVWRG